MTKRIITLILALTCLIFTFCACSCESTDETTQTTKKTNTPQEEKPNDNSAIIVKCDHFWTDADFSTETDSTGSANITLKCGLCKKGVSKEYLTRIDYEDWKLALGAENKTSFTLVNGGEITNFAQNGAMSYRIIESVYSEDYFVNYPEKSATSFFQENLAGYKMMYESFEYVDEYRAYVYTINENARIELRFADKQLFSITTVSLDGENESKSCSLYLNFGSANADVPSYFFEQYNSVTAKEAIESSNVSDTMVENILTLLNTLSFDSKHEISFIENSRLSVYFHIDSLDPDPVFGESYTFVFISAYDGKLNQITIGQNTIEFTY